MDLKPILYFCICGDLDQPLRTLIIHSPIIFGDWPVVRIWCTICSDNPETLLLRLVQCVSQYRLKILRADAVIFFGWDKADPMSSLPFNRPNTGVCEWIVHVMQHMIGVSKSDPTLTHQVKANVSKNNRELHIRGQFKNVPLAEYGHGAFLCRSVWLVAN
jgi:hypothetical protein